MASFVALLKTNAVWIYLFLIFSILIGIKMLVDAQRLSRTTLFSLDQEHATEQTYRGLILIVAALVFMFVLTGMVLFVAPLAPSTESAILRGPTATLAAIVFPTSTTMPSATATRLPATETAFFTTTPPVATTTRTITHTVLLPAQSPTATPLFPMPAPRIIGPVPNGGTWTGEGQATAAMTFRWECEKCVLGQGDWYEIVISYSDKLGVLRTVAGRTRDNFLPLRRIYDGGGFELYHQAREDAFSWFVQVKREPGNLPISPPSETWKFIWH